MDRIRGIAVRIGILILLLFAGVQAQADECSHIYPGTNAGVQSYERFGEPVYSYLVPVDGLLMRFQGNCPKPAAVGSGGETPSAAGSASFYLAEYYDTDYRYLRSCHISRELPLFGAFYCDGENYYILTGDTNPDENDQKEVFRLTKYDQDWERLASVRVRGANTVEPFASGSARIESSGNILILRTCHRMYQSDDGKNHQASMTLRFNTETMTLLDANYGVSDSSRGYASHSFNQFLQIDQERMIAVDHGDAYPRSVVLFSSRSDCTKDSFDYKCVRVDLLTIPGRTGDNVTGVSVGGLEVSEEHYLTAVNTLHMEDGGWPGGERDIAILTADRDRKESPSLIWFTGEDCGVRTEPAEVMLRIPWEDVEDSGEADDRVSTPQLAKVDDDRFLLLWTRGTRLYYVPVDGSGRAAGSIRELTGRLSDCAPVLWGRKLLWYVWEDGRITFYEIDTEDLSIRVTGVQSGHDYEAVFPAEGENRVIFRCRHCGDEQQQTTLTGFFGYWSSGTSGRLDTVLGKTGQTIRFETLDLEPEDAELPDLTCVSEDESVVRIEGDRAVLVGKGVTTVRVYATYNPSVSMEFTFYVDLKPLGSVKISLSYTSCTYSGNLKKPKVTVRDNTDPLGEAVKLTEGKDFKVTYKNNRNAGTATVTVKGIGGWTGTRTLKYTIKQAANTVTVSGVTRTTGTKALSFSLNAGAKGDAKLTYKSDVSKVKVSSKGKVTVPAGYVGTAKITVTAAATSNYKKAAKTVTVRVNPRGTTLAKLTGQTGKKLKIAWNKQTGITGYQLYVSTKSDFSANLKKYLVSGSGTLSKTLSGLTKNKTYYVKIRTYKTVKDVKYYSSWSKSKYLKITK